MQGRGALKRGLVACLRTGRALRVPRGGARALGRRPDYRAEPVGDRHPGRAHDPVHHALAPATHGRPRRSPGQERPRARRARCRGGPGRDRRHHHPAQPLLDNAVVESWHSTLEWELRRVERFATKAQAPGQGRGLDRGLQHHSQALIAGMSAPSPTGGREGGLTMGPASPPQGCAGARPSPGGSSQGLTTLRGLQLDRPALRQFHDSYEKRDKARSAQSGCPHFQGNPRSCCQPRVSSFLELLRRRGDNPGEGPEGFGPWSCLSGHRSCAR